MKFNEAQITDQKRFVRGEQFLYARSRLRCRDEAHNKKWRVLILAGGSPRGEIQSIRELMPQAQITALDNDQKCLEAAIEAGADDVILQDLADKTSNGRPTLRLPEDQRFDLAHLDLCSNPNPVTRRIAKFSRSLVKKRGILIFTFSYGRDVEELFLEAFGNARAYCLKNNKQDILQPLQDKGVSPSVCGRIRYLFPLELEMLQHLHSVMLYRGANVPMCSLLFQLEVGTIMSVVKVEPGDFELAVVYPDAANLYDCPRERIEALRRKFSAIKASYTRKEKAPSALELV